MPRFFATLEDAIRFSIEQLKNYEVEVNTGHWQGVPTEGKPDLLTMEFLWLDWLAQMPDSLSLLQAYVQPNLPWAEAHFQERVGRVPSNPGEEYQNWPWWQGQFEATASVVPRIDFFQFTHTYQERFWPKQAGDPYPSEGIHIGTRYPYGDLDDVVDLLYRHPFTRQAYLPVFFPEDTGAVHGGRIPCSLGYHFLLRGDRLHLWYDIRSCDAVRHFRDDVYLAVRLCQWIIAELQVRDNDYDAQEFWEGVVPGNLHFSAHSFHVHKGDRHLL